MVLRHSAVSHNWCAKATRHISQLDSHAKQRKQKVHVVKPMVATWHLHGSFLANACAAITKAFDVIVELRLQQNAWQLNGKCIANALQLHSKCIANAGRMHGKCMATAW